MERQKEWLEIIDIKKLGKSELVHAHKTVCFKVCGQPIYLRWGTSTRKVFKVGEISFCSFSTIDAYMENNKIILVVENLRLLR